MFSYCDKICLARQKLKKLNVWLIAITCIIRSSKIKKNLFDYI